MKPIKRIIGIVALFFAFAIHTFAIEGLEVSVQSTNAVLNWPSVDDGSETYLIQYRSNLNASSSWLTLTDYFSAAPDTNTTLFVHTNAVSPVTGFYRVVRDGAYMYVTNGTLWTDFVTVPVELGNSYGTAGTMSLTENGDPIGDSIQPAGTSLLVDSTQMSNGLHQVSVSTSWSDTNGNYIEADSPPVSVIVSNEISYPDWIPAYGELGNSVAFQAMSAHTNADWEIDVYGSDYYYIGSFTGTTTDGNIQVAWNLVDPEGNVRTNDTFFICEITTWYDTDSGADLIHPLATGSSSSVTPPTYKVNDPWLGPGKFAIAVQHAWDTTVDHELLYDELSGFTGAANGTFGVLPSQSGDVPYAIPFSGPNGSNGDPATGWATFKSAVFDPYARNLAYFGHGGEVGLGYNTSNTNFSLLATEIAANLHTIPAGQMNIHRFRFVFVDGCSTAKGEMPEAFGIIHKVGVPSINYLYASLRPSCYCGWDDDKSIDYINGAAINYGHVNFITHIQDNMLLNGETIGKAVDDASRSPDVISSFTTTGDFKIYGCPDVTFGSNNN